MDLSRKTNLSQQDEFEVGSILHALLVEEIFRASEWLSSDAVFHGGTALAFARQSDRFSEDLDFMVTDAAAASLSDLVAKSVDRVALSIAGLLPGSSIELRGPAGDEIVAWQVVWTHPQRRGRVMVKLEFLVTQASLLAAYRSSYVVPLPRGAVSVTTPVPMPELSSAWADKLKAIATRPSFKWRDAYDVAWLTKFWTFGAPPPADESIAALEATAAIYGKTLDDVQEGLERVLASGVFDDSEAFENDMERWFESAHHRRLVQTGHLRAMLATTKSEVERTIELIRAHKHDHGHKSGR